MQVPRGFFNEVIHLRIFFDDRGIGYSPAREFVSNAAGSTEEVECFEG